MQVPFILLTVNTPFEFTDSEAANLGAYLTGGGFLFADIVSILWPNYSDVELDIPTVRSLIRASFQAVGYQEWKDWQFRRLELTHPLYHCFYDCKQPATWDARYALSNRRISTANSGLFGGASW